MFYCTVQRRLRSSASTREYRFAFPALAQAAKQEAERARECARAREKSLAILRHGNVTLRKQKGPQQISPKYRHAGVSMPKVSSVVCHSIIPLKQPILYLHTPMNCP